MSDTRDRSRAEAHERIDTAMTPSTTPVDAVNPFDSTVMRQRPSASGRESPLTSDPPTALVLRNGFRELPPGSVVDDIYEIDARLGGGAMGEVYAARHMKLGKRVAIKVIGQRLSEDAAAMERFVMEAKTLAQMQHPAIVAVDHVGELADGRAFFSMELLLGESLFDRLQRGRVPLPEALRILDQMARGLDAAHGEGVTHRDLKPENVFLVHLPGEPAIIKLVDFGLSKLTAARAGDDQRAERTQSGVAIGTPMYMSPEQMRGPDVDHRTDIYALGVVAYELVLGVPPFPHARTVPELYAAHLHDSPPLPRSIWPEIPPQLDLALFAMLAKDPAHRPTLAQVRAVIADVSTKAPSQRAATEFVGPRAAKPPRRTFAIAAVVIVALVGGITIGAKLTSGTSSPAVPIAPIEQVSSPTTQPPVDAPAPPSVDTIDKIPRPEAPTRSTVRSATPSRAKRAPPPAPTPQNIAIEAGVAEIPDPPQRPKPPPPVDRNQTINPFKRKVNP